MNKLLHISAGTLCLLLSSSKLFAAPMVDGNTISWPDDGWYQVQSSSTLLTVCEGGRSCQVSDGGYFVINHTSGERFEHIVITGSDGSLGGIGNPVVSGNTISWSDNGWYQVQDAATFETICEGGTSCEVPQGSYNIINHSLDQRFQGVQVDATLIESDAVTGISVSGNTVTWPNDGWYQVQTAATFDSICEGGQSCVVPAPGQYRVINHSSGQRTLVDVGESGASDLVQTGGDNIGGNSNELDARLEALLTSVGQGSPLSVNNSRAFLPHLFLLVNTEPANRIFNTFTGFYSQALDAHNGEGESAFVVITQTDQVTTLACPEGGSYSLQVISPVGFQVSLEEGAAHSFDNCRFDDEVMHGEITSEIRDPGSSTGSGTILRHLGDQAPLELQIQSGLTITATDFFLEVTSRFIPGGTVTLSMGSNSLTYEHNFTISERLDNTRDSFGRRPPYQILRVGMSINGALTNNRTIQVETPEPFRRYEIDSTLDIGQLIAIDESGGQMSLTMEAGQVDRFTVRVDTDGLVDSYIQNFTDEIDINPLPTL